MAARRLIVVLVLLLAISIAAAAMAPERSSVSSEDESSSTATGADDGPASGGQSVERQIVASPESPGTVRAEAGDRLGLNVESETPLEVEIEDFGLIANADPVAPARFDLLLADPGEVELTDAATGEVLGRIIIESAAAPLPPEAS